MIGFCISHQKGSASRKKKKNTSREKKKKERKKKKTQQQETRRGQVVSMELSRTNTLKTVWTLSVIEQEV